MDESSEFLKDVTKCAADDFLNHRSILSFEQFIALTLKEPHLHLRNSAKYFLDFLEKFGSYEIKTSKSKRFSIWDEKIAEELCIFGQERVQEAIVNHIKNFCRYGYVDKLLMLHGPNGSAKTTIIAALMRAAEKYSHMDEGALYHFSWVFPKKNNQSTLGFQKNGSSKELTSFAYLADEDIVSQIRCEQKDHPLLLLPIKDREKLFIHIKNKCDDLEIPKILKQGQLSHKNRQIFTNLLSANHGDLNAVFRHIRVERFYLSKRYREGISVVEPQMSVDAHADRILNEHTTSSLPPSLKHLSTYEVFGPLVEANRGIIEYSDLLKRPIEAFKYLLAATEQGEVSTRIPLAFDTLMLATSNELHMSGFRQYADWPSFKGRMEFIKVPYLLKVSEERKIYEYQIPKALSGLHIAPHAILIAARFAVLTRLEPLKSSRCEDALKDLVQSITPEEKLELYDSGAIPLRLSQKDGKILNSEIEAISKEYENDENYEGRFGASPREIRTLLLAAAQDRDFDHLSVSAVFSKLSQLIEQKSSYEFLRREPVRGFRDADYLLHSVKIFYRSVLEEEVRSAVGLFSKNSYLELFIRYITHVSSWVKKERLFDQRLNRVIDPDEQFMMNTESPLLAINESREEFRKHLIGQIGAFKLEQPEKELDYNTLFSAHIRRLKEKLYDEQAGIMDQILKTYLVLEQNDSINDMSNKNVSYALNLKKGLFDLGYNDSSAKAAILFLLQDQVLKLGQQHLKF